jgi:alanine dehydrogenase
MPAAVPVTATRALTNATLPWIARLADAGVADGIRADPALRSGVNVVAGSVTCAPVARAAGLALAAA